MPEQINFLVSSLPDYVEQNKLGLIKEIVATGDTINRITIQPGIKSKAKLNYLLIDTDWQDGSTCGFNASGSIELTQREIATGQIKVNDEICPKTLLGKWAEYLVRIGAKKEELPFEKFILDTIVEKQRQKLEIAVWQADTDDASDSSVPGYLKRFDGFLKLMGEDSNVTKVNIASGATAYDAIEAVVEAVSDEIENVSIHVSPALFRLFCSDLVKKNFYHYSGPVNDAPKEVTFPGTDIAVVRTYGLKGTRNIVACNDKEMFYGTDLMSNAEEIDLWYSKDDRLFKYAIEFNAGVQYAFSERVVLGTMAGNPAKPKNTDDVVKQLSTIATKVTALAKLADEDHVFVTSESEDSAVAVAVGALAAEDHVFNTKEVTEAAA